jgi:hypothetical protein
MEFMSRNTILAPSRPVTTTVVDATPAAWKIVAWCGIVLILVGLSDIVLVFYPWRMGEPGWEFGVLTSALSSLPIVVVGFAGWIGSSVARGRKTATRVLGVLSVVFGVLIVSGFLVYLTNVPLALQNSPEQVLVGVKKSIMRTSIMAVVFGALFIVSGIAAIRAHREAKT